MVKNESPPLHISTDETRTYLLGESSVQPRMPGVQAQVGVHDDAQEFVHLGGNANAQ
jgi:hypothetical protein